MSGYHKCMFTVVELKDIAMDKIKSGGKWLDRKLRRTSLDSFEEQNLRIGPPTNFRREDITLHTETVENARLVEQAREDAQRIYEASRRRQNS